MIKQKRLMIVFIAIFASVALFSGCSSKVESIKTKSAEEAMNLFNKYNEEDDIPNMVSLYSDVYLDSMGYSTKQVLQGLKNTRGKIDVTKSVIENIEDIDENAKAAKVKITANIDGKEQTDTYNYAIIKEDGGWAVSPDGITKNENFNVPAPKDDELNINLSKVITTFDGALIRCTVINNSKSAFMFGGNGNKCEVVVETSEGVFNTFLDEEVKLDKNSKTYFMSRIIGLTGEVNKVTIKSVYNVDSKGNIDSNSQHDIIVYKR